ncbi:unnamed protein product [Darwinula stevensoni]|uniref:Serine/threonine-protein phosphatase 4 regulatory subunit 2 n=1 Tax=Darwinula stevensoni TaxID=69355 RepID=A0A7R8X4C1_9CRUS|nr:unnamed protein product [Darwinula stevensoni]CAG0879365.1 unnamed protein product [Darwinula stevensoni]
MTEETALASNDTHNAHQTENHSLENAEAVLQALEDFEKQLEVTSMLEDFLHHVAKTGETVFPWPKVKPVVKVKMERVLQEFLELTPPEEIVTHPNVPRFDFGATKNFILDRLDGFNGLAPFTIQRICELLVDPTKHYKRVDKFLRGLEKNVNVVSGVEPIPVKRQDPPPPVLLNGILGSQMEVEDIPPDKRSCPDSTTKLSSASSQRREEQSHLPEFLPESKADDETDDQKDDLAGDKENNDHEEKENEDSEDGESENETPETLDENKETPPLEEGTEEKEEPPPAVNGSLDKSDNSDTDRTDSEQLNDMQQKSDQTSEEDEKASQDDTSVFSLKPKGEILKESENPDEDSLIGREDGNVSPLAEDQEESVPSLEVEDEEQIEDDEPLSKRFKWDTCADEPPHRSKDQDSEENSDPKMETPM